MSEFLTSFGEWRFGGWLVIALIMCGVLFWLRRKYLDRKISEINSQVFKEHNDNPFERVSDIADEVTRRSEEIRFFTNIKYSLIALVVALGGIYIAFFSLRLPVSSSPAEWGQMGDFFGGMLNPILAFASFIALLYTIRIQSEELRLTRREFEKSVKAQQRIAEESEKQLSQQVLLEDYRYISNKLRTHVAAAKELLVKNIPHNGFPIGSTPPGSIGELVTALGYAFYATQKDEPEDIESCFERARVAHRNKCEPQNPIDLKYYVAQIDGLLFPYLSMALELVDIIDAHSDIGKHVKLEEVQQKIRLADSSSAIYLVACAYILARTFTRFSKQFNYNHFTFKDEGRRLLFKNALVNLRLPSEALNSL